MTWEFVGQCVLGAIIIAAWFAVIYAACNRDYQHKLRAQRDVELAALDAASKDRFNPTHYDVQA